ncbi:MAG: cation:proton antiporter [Chloroflexota bacterium]|nr:cation:proton antiporter [Chloroflexota bacterium]
MLTGYILLQLVFIILAVQLCGFLCRLVGQQWVIGEILAGLILGPSLLGSLWPGLKEQIFVSSALPTLQTLGDIGLVLYMFSLGTRLDTGLMQKQSRKALTTSLSGVLLPLALGGTLAFFLYPNFAGNKANLLSFMLIVGTSLSITAFPVLARLLMEKRMVNTRLGTLALTCAVVDDVIAWCLLALVIAIAHATGLIAVALTLGAVVIFALVMFMVVRPLLLWADRHIRSQQLMIAFTMVGLLLSAYLTNAIGIHPVFGAFVMGVILPRRARFVAYIRSIDQVNNTLFLPLFFVYSGLRTQIGLINTPWLWFLCVLALIIACVGKIGGVTLCARFMGDSWKEASSLGVLMNTRGLVELIVLNIGLSLGILSPSLFAMLVIMALVTTMMASPLLHWLGHRQPPPENLALEGGLVQAKIEVIDEEMIR